MDEEAHSDAEEVILFPDHAPTIAADHGSRSSYELLGAMGQILPPAGFRDWLAGQLAQIEAQARKQTGLTKPAGITPEVAAYIQAREAQAGRKATKDAYMKVLNKLDHFARQGGAELG